VGDRIPTSLRRKVLWGAAGAALLVGLVLGGRFVLAGGRPTAAGAVPAPVAPASVAPRSEQVPFDHAIHAGQYKMACLFCHVDADKSTTAGLPSVRKCMGCHKFVDKDKPAVEELAMLWEGHQTPRWRRVYDLPDYVYFSHRVHVAAEVACTTCHGDVPSMHQITRASSLSMGWCLDCHEQRHAPLDCVTCHK